MGSTKHIRNNGEHLNIHGHDNYQMPGAYKQMGDKNQNQSLGAYKLVGDQEMMQPGKISGGAAKYIKESYGASKADYDKDMAEERIQIKDDKEKIYQDDKEKKESYGANKIDDPEKTEAEKKAANESRIRSKADDVGNFRYERSVQKGGARDSMEGLISGTASNIATRVTGAVRDLDKINPNLSTRSQSDIIDKATKISGFNTDKLHNEYISRGGGSYDHMKERASLTSYGKRGGGYMSKKQMQAIGDSGKTLNQELDAEKSRFSRSNQFYDALKRGAKGYDSEGKHLTLNQQTGFKPASPTFANFSTPSKQEFNSLVKKDGPNKGIHSSKSKGINKILKQYK